MVQKEKSSKFIFDIPNDNKKLFKAMCARSELTMSEVLNDLIKKVKDLEEYKIGQ
jgi:hypothetical protein